MFWALFWLSFIVKLFYKKRNDKHKERQRQDIQEKHTGGIIILGDFLKIDVGAQCSFHFYAQNLHILHLYVRHTSVI
jgi:hypothetical protein